MFLMINEKKWNEKEGFVDNEDVPPYSVNLNYCRKLYINKQTRNFTDESFQATYHICYSVMANVEGQPEDIVMGSFLSEKEAVSYIKTLTNLINKNV